MNTTRNDIVALMGLDDGQLKRETIFKKGLVVEEMEGRCQNLGPEDATGYRFDSMSLELNHPVLNSLPEHLFLPK